MNPRMRSYTAYSIAVGIVWAVLLLLVSLLASPDKRHTFFVVFGGFAIAWLSATIARYVYPPPKKYRRYHQIRTGTPGPGSAAVPGRGTQDPAATPDRGGSKVIPDGLIGRAARHAEQAATVADALAELEQQILGKILQVVSGPGGAASFLRRNLLGKGLSGPSLPLDVGQTDDIPVHLRRLVALRDRGLPVPRRLRPARGRLRGPPRDPPGRRRPDQPGQPQGLLLVAPPRRAAPARLDPDHPPRRHQPRPKPRRQDHPQPQPPTQARVT